MREQKQIFNRIIKTHLENPFIFIAYLGLIIGLFFLSLILFELFNIWEIIKN